jgi:hypothetical protein
MKAWTQLFSNNLSSNLNLLQAKYIRYEVAQTKAAWVLLGLKSPEPGLALGLSQLLSDFKSGVCEFYQWNAVAMYAIEYAHPNAVFATGMGTDEVRTSRAEHTLDN